jgi:hypothetical protein
MLHLPSPQDLILNSASTAVCTLLGASKTTDVWLETANVSGGPTGSWKTENNLPTLHNRAGKTCFLLERQPAISQDSDRGLAFSFGLDLLENDNILTSLNLKQRHIQLPLCGWHATLNIELYLSQNQSMTVMLLREDGKTNKMLLMQIGDEKKDIARFLWS